MINTRLSEGMTETLDILNHMDKKYIEKIPKDFMNFLEENKSIDYKPDLNHSLKIDEMDLKEETKDILSVIYMNYWCNDNEKSEYINLLNKNEQAYQNEVNEKYNPDKLFANKNKYSNQEMVVINEKPKTIFQKIIVFIKNILK